MAQASSQGSTIASVPFAKLFVHLKRFDDVHCAFTLLLMCGNCDLEEGTRLDYVQTCMLWLKGCHWTRCDDCSQTAFTARDLLIQSNPLLQLCRHKAYRCMMDVQLVSGTHVWTAWLNFHKPSGGLIIQEIHPEETTDPILVWKRKAAAWLRLHLFAQAQDWICNVAFAITVHKCSRSARYEWLQDHSMISSRY